jgi:hypothetical protein
MIITGIFLSVRSFLNNLLTKHRWWVCFIDVDWVGVAILEVIRPFRW